MAFSSIPFLCAFFPLVVIGYYLIPSIRIKNCFLIIASLLFYSYGEGYYVLLMISCAFFNYIFTRLIARADKTKKFLLLLAVVGNLGMLGIYKYSGMVLTTVNNITDLNIKVPDIHLPVGISFFTFQALSYVIDVYRGRVEADKSFLKILLYISFFPQLIAGPIIKYHSISRQIDQRSVNMEKISRGMRRFVIGLSKKVLLSDTIAVTVDYVFALQSDELGMAAAWIGAASYMLQIYFDFSGYSDMAIGMGKMFGFDFAENFCYPYIASSIQEFWRRWHISLTDWFREYLYIPLGGNRKGKVRTWINRLIVFFCTGLWHGANWTFVLWGLFHGMFLTLETIFQRKRNRFRVLGHIYVLFVVCVGFVLFRADTVEQAFMIIMTMFTKTEWNSLIAASTIRIFDRLFLLVFPIAIVCSMPVGQWMKAWVDRRRKKETYCKIADGFGYVGSLVLLLVCIMSLAGGTFHPFIYFRF